MPRSEPVRRCVISGESGPNSRLIRLAQGPDGRIVADLAAKLPGRGAWISADRSLIDQALASRKLVPALCRALKTKVPAAAVPDDLVAQISELLERRLLQRIGLMRRAGYVILGFEKIAAQMRKDRPAPPALWLTAADGAEDGQRKMRAAIGPGLPGRVVFDRERLSRALGRENVVHLLLLDGGGVDSVTTDLARLEGVWGQPARSV